jgi:predicted metal-dependent phosphoesterase TrpH
MHTTASDGRLTPTELVELAASKGLRTISVSDHDTTAGLEEAQRAVDRVPGMRLIPGIELGCDVPGGECTCWGTSWT